MSGRRGSYGDGAVDDGGPQHVVMYGQCVQRLPDQCRVDGALHAEHHRLDEPAGLCELPAEETSLEGTRLDGSRHGFLRNGRAVAAAD